MADDVETPDPALDVECPWEGGCGAPAGEPCRTSYAGQVHAERRRLHNLRTLDQGVCADCGRFLVRGSHEPGGPVEVWHPDPSHHDCPPFPDPRTDWNAYAEALNSGAKPGHVAPDRFVSAEALEHVQAMNLNEVALPTPDLDARIDALHGPGAAAALDAAIEDGSIFTDPTLRVRGSVSVEVAVICPECDNGKHQNCDGRALHPITDELTDCTCRHDGSPA